MLIPTPKASSSRSPFDLDLALLSSSSSSLLNTDSPSSSPPAPPGTTRRHRDSISFFLPIFILTVLLIILVLSFCLARCLYRRFKSMHHLSSSTSPSHPSSGSSWKAYSSTTYGSNDRTHRHHRNNDNSEAEGDVDEDEDERTEQERLLARRRSTSYYDANRSRAPVAVTIQHDAKGRPISTWSTASSVAAQRGEELSRWSRRRDDLIKIYGQSHVENSGSFDNQQQVPLAEEEEEVDPEDLVEGQQRVQHGQVGGLEHHGQGHGLGQGRFLEVGESHTHSHSHHLNVPTHTQHAHTHSSEHPLGPAPPVSQRSSRVTTTSTLLDEESGGGGGNSQQRKTLEQHGGM